MANWFEDVTKTLADEKIGRRTAIRRVGGTIAGVALAGAIPGLALAANKRCPGGGGTCTTGFSNCTGPNTNCFCFTGINGKKVLCGCNQFCSQLPTCTSQAGCAKGSHCSANNGCNSCSTTLGVCITDCKGANKNCQLGSGHGSTAAR